MPKKISSNGFSVIETIVVLLVVALLGITGWFIWRHNHQAKKTSTNTGSSATQKQTPQTSQAQTADPYVGWKTYSNSTHGVSFKYPPNWVVEGLPIANPSGINPSEYSISLKLDIERKYNDTIELNILTSSLAQATKFYDGYYGQSSQSQISKKSLDLKGKQAVSYDVTAGPQKIKLYLLSVGEKTYSFGSINEELNEQTSSTYWTDFNKVFDSLTIQ